MPTRILNFQKRFAPDVESGIKTTTIRAKRKDGRDPKMGDMLALYTGLRTKAARLLRRETCFAVDPIMIQPSIAENDHLVWVGDVMLNNEGVAAMARQDGFASAEEFIGYFRKSYGLPFNGYLIGWKPERKTS
jgi:hypothetical protein